MARANPQWRDFEELAKEDGEALVVFQGPHAYISPSWYGAGPAVPTWNYTAVHAYGRPHIVEDPARVRAILEQLVAVQESALDPPWTLDSQTDKYLSGMMRGIVAFEIPIERLEAKAKLGQNKSAAQAAGAAAALARSEDPMARETAALMRAARGDDRR
jgi:transcriptional regulator